jgi:tRNA A-37 threonylcarbamoyl transferase component Bud32
MQRLLLLSLLVFTGKVFSIVPPSISPSSRPPLCNATDFFPIQFLGRGRDANVALVNSLSQQRQFTRKECFPTRIQRCVQEVQFLIMLANTGLSPTLHCSSADNKLMILDYIPGEPLMHIVEDGDLKATLARAGFDSSADTDAIFISIVHTMFQTIQRLHNSKVYHGDLHLGNWLIGSSDGHTPDVHLIDFGQATAKSTSILAAASQSRKDVTTLGTQLLDLYEEWQPFDKKSEKRRQFESLLRAISGEGPGKKGLGEVLQDPFFAPVV